MSLRTLLRTKPVAAGAILTLALWARPSLAQAPPRRVAVDATCAATCQRESDRWTAVAARNLAEKNYYVAMMSANCPAPWNTTHSACSETYLACDAQCGASDAECRQHCTEALQPCCHAVEIANVARSLEQCLAECPGASVVSTLEAPGSVAAKDLALSLAPWGPTKEALWEERQAMKTPAERARNDEARQELFRAAHANLTAMRGTFAIVSGGGGRLWVLKSDGTTVKMSAALAGLLRNGLNSPDSETQAIAALTKTDAGMGFTRDDAIRIVTAIQLWPVSMGSSFGSGFSPGPPNEPLYFTEQRDPWQLNRARGSSEHSTIHGTINGGGDFI